LTVAQTLPEPAGGLSTLALESFFHARKALIALESSQVGSASKLPDRLMNSGDAVVGNPLGRLLAIRGGQVSARTLLRARQLTGAVDVIGKLEDEKVIYDSYLIWLLAEVVSSKNAEDTGIMNEVDLTGWIADTNAVRVRAFAGLTLSLRKSNLTPYLAILVSCPWRFQFQAASGSWNRPRQYFFQR
jgi:hypothetical protein